MTKVKNLYFRFAVACSALLTAVMFICANTTSCSMIYEPEAPDGLDRFSKIG